MLPLLALGLAVGVGVSQNVGEGNRDWYARATAAQARRLNQTSKTFFGPPVVAEVGAQKAVPAPSLSCTITVLKADPSADVAISRKTEEEIDSKMARRSDCRD